MFLDNLMMMMLVFVIFMSFSFIVVDALQSIFHILGWYLIVLGADDSFVPQIPLLIFPVLG